MRIPAAPRRPPCLSPPCGHTLALATDGAASEASSGPAAAVMPKPRWFTPLRLLLIFCFANIMVYLDRGGHLGQPHVHVKQRASAPAAAMAEPPRRRCCSGHSVGQAESPARACAARAPLAPRRGPRFHAAHRPAPRPCAGPHPAGVIASNGVNGSPRTVDQPKGSGIQVRPPPQVGHALACLSIKGNRGPPRAALGHQLRTTSCSSWCW